MRISRLLFGLGYFCDSLDVLDIVNWLKFFDGGLIVLRHLNLASADNLLLLTIVDELHNLFGITSCFWFNCLVSCTLLRLLVHDLWQLGELNSRILLGVRLFNTVSSQLSRNIHIHVELKLVALTILRWRQMNLT